MKTFVQFSKEALAGCVNRVKVVVQYTEADTSVAWSSTHDLRGADANKFILAMHAAEVQPRLQTLYAAYVARQVEGALDKAFAKTPFKVQSNGRWPDTCSACDAALFDEPNFCGQCGAKVAPETYTLKLDSCEEVRGHWDGLSQAQRARAMVQVETFAGAYARGAKVWFKGGRDGLAEYILTDLEEA